MGKLAETAGRIDGLLVRMGAADEGLRGRLVAAALSAVLWPGAGQAFRRRYLAGALIALGALLLLVSWSVVAALGIARAFAEAGGDPGEIGAAVSSGLRAQAGPLVGLLLLLGLVWLYAVADAALVAPKRADSQASTRA